MKKNQKEIQLPEDNGSGKQEVRQVSKSKFIYYALIVLAVAGLIVAIAL